MSRDGSIFETYRSPETPLVRVRGLRLRLPHPEGAFDVLHGLDFDLEQGRTLCLLGESGSGKSLTLRALIRLLPAGAELAGSIVVAGADVGALRPRELRLLRGPVASMIFQEPSAALDPAYTIGQQIAETVRTHEGASWAAARKRSLELLDLVQIPLAARRLDAYPHELSGGLRQRAMIAVALSCRPKLLLADEPTTALDATVRSQILDLLRRLQSELDMGMIFVTHDIAVAERVADDVMIMYAGRFVETGRAGEVFGQPAHPYTVGLLRSDAAGRKRGERLEPIPGGPPDPRRPPQGCAFAPRCAEAKEACQSAVPRRVALSTTQAVCCILVEERELDARLPSAASTGGGFQ